MRLTQEQLENYHQQGYLVIERYFSPAELELLREFAALTPLPDSTLLEMGVKVG
jgi:hypothetical protein